MANEKRLIELLSQVQYLGGLEEKLADHLIANGVVIKSDCEDCASKTTRIIDKLHGEIAKQKWISVKDRLPKPGERVLVCVGAVFEAFIDDHGNWQRYYSAPLNDVLGEPTHWMHLPQPPKGE